jgi:hypothetical protein
MFFPIDLEEKIMESIVVHLKGLSHERDLAFGNMYSFLSSRPKYGTGHFLNFLVGDPMIFITQKVYFLQLMLVYVGLIMLAACS